MNSETNTFKFRERWPGTAIYDGTLKVDGKLRTAVFYFRKQEYLPDEGGLGRWYFEIEADSGTTDGFRRITGGDDTFATLAEAKQALRELQAAGMRYHYGVHAYCVDWTND